MVKILGVDLGTTNLGVSILDFAEQPKVIFCEYLKLEKGGIPEKLSYLYNYFGSMVNAHEVTHISFENPFFSSKNGNAIVMVGGILMLIAGQRGLPIESYTASQVKKCVTGSGKADKKEVEDSIKTHLPFESSRKFESGGHTSDSIAIGLTYYIKELRGLKNE